MVHTKLKSKDTINSNGKKVLASSQEFYTFLKPCSCVVYFLNFKTGDRPFLKILLLAPLPLRKAFCAS